MDLALIDHDDRVLSDPEWSILNTATQHDAQTLYLLQTVPGVGKILSPVLLYEMHDIDRFPRVQDVVSSCRLVKCEGIGGKALRHLGDQDWHAYLTWAFSEAAVLLLRANPAGQKHLARIEKKYGKGKALTVLTHKLAGAVSDMLQRHTAFEMRQLLHQ